MNSRLKVLSAVLPFAMLAGAAGTAAEPGRTAVQMPVAQPAVPAEAAKTAFTSTYESHLTLKADRTATEVSTKRFKILAPSAITVVSEQKEIYDQSLETLETVEAFTQKADGTKVPVNAANIITRDAVTGLQSTFTRDLKERIVIFQDVQVGDTLVLTHRKQTRGMFAGQYFDAAVFLRTQPVTSAQFIIEAPAALDLQVKTTGTSLTDRVENVGNIRRHTVTYASTAFAPAELRSVAPIDVDPMLLVSTFKSYVDFGRAYGAAALPKATVTPEISALAEEITKGIQDRRQQAQAIDAWMKKNIRYVAVYLSVGRVVPHDAASVLHNKFGDCKDKATLMAALLAAKGIASEHVLVNLGNAYTLPEPPTMVALNHVILYLPQFDLYVDPTANFAAFGVLAAEAYDKPVVRVSAKDAKLARTPAMRPEDHVAYAHTALKVAADGTVSGRTVESNTGIFGMVLRGVAAQVQNLGSENAARMQLQGFNTPGNGRFELGNVTDTADPVVVEGTFALNQKFTAPPQGARAFIPFGMPLTARPGNFLLGNLPNNRTMPFTCFAGRQVEDIDATYDQPLPMPFAPPPVTIENGTFTYKATFKIEGRTFKTHREFVAKVPGQVCQPELEARLLGDMNSLRGNVNMSYAFQVAAPPAAATAPAPTSPTVRPTPVSTTTGAAPAAPAAPKTVELNRTVAADGKIRLDFLYSINPDCTSIGFATIRMIEQPKHGKITIENGTGFTNFPDNNPRVECNKRRSDGVVVTYEPAPGYTGPDSVDFDTIFPTGSLSKRHYTIAVR
jgi:transglutaminase-like putative cysteine protease